MKSLTWSTQAVPTVMRAGRFYLDDQHFNHTYSGPTHSLHVYDYTADMDLGGERVHLRPGDCTLSPAGGETRYHLDQPGYHWCIHFLPGPLVGDAVAIPSHQSIGPLKRQVGDAVARIGGIVAGANGHPLALAQASVALQDLLLTLAWHAVQVPSARGEAGNEAAEAAALLVDVDVLSPPSIPALAKRVGVSQTHLARVFRARYGMTIARYVLSQRLEEAQFLLLTTDIPVGSIAHRLGFVDSQHFNKQFRRVVGCSPTQHRRQGMGPIPPTGHAQPNFSSQPRPG